MSTIRDLLKTEPARLISFIAAVLGLVVSYGLVSQVRADAWIAFATLALPVVLPLIQGALTRQNVYSKDTVQKLADRATYQKAGTKVDIGQPPDASPPLPAEG